MKELSSSSLPRGLVNYYRELSYTPVVPVAWYAASSPLEMKAVAERAFVYHGECVAAMRTKDYWLAEQEGDSTARLLCDWRWKGFLPFEMTDDAYQFSNERQAEILSPYVERVSGSLLNAAAGVCAGFTRESLLDEATYPTNKGKSAPFWPPGTNREAALALVALSRGARSLEEIQERCHHIGATMPLCITLYTRIQAAKSPRTVWYPDAQGRRMSGGLALLPKVRKVQAVPFLANFQYAALGHVLMLAVRASDAEPGLLPSLQSVVDATRGVPRSLLYGQDISNFDDSVGVQLFRAVTDHLIVPCARMMEERGLLTSAETDLIVSTESALPSMELLGPPVRFGAAATLVNRSGGIVSGQRLTSVIGTVINRAQTRYAIDVAGLSQAPLGVYTFGDDSLLHLANEDDVSRLSDLTTSESYTANTGFVSERAPDATFLQRRMGGDDPGYAYLGRMILSTLQKEATHEPRSMPIAALGIAARRNALKGHPFAAAYDRFVKASTPRLVAAYDLARALDWEVDKLGKLVLDGVGLERTGGSSAASQDEFSDTMEELFATGAISDQLMESVASVVASSNPSIARLNEASMAYSSASGAEPNYRKIGRELRYEGV